MSPGEVAAAIRALRDTAAADDTAVVVAAGDATAAVIGPGYGRAVCVQNNHLVSVDHLPTVAAVVRALLKEAHPGTV